MVRSYEEHRARIVEAKALDLRGLRTAPQLVEPLPSASIPHAHERAAFGGGREEGSVPVEREA